MKYTTKFPLCCAIAVTSNMALLSYARRIADHEEHYFDQLRRTLG